MKICESWRQRALWGEDVGLCSFIETVLCLWDTIITSAELFGQKIIGFYVPTKHSIHAEQDCIHKFLKKYGRRKKMLKNCTLILVKMDKKGDLINCEPCNKCAKILQKYEVGRVIVYYERELIKDNI